jgi:hypothetical protein
MKVITGAGSLTPPDPPDGADWVERLRVADLGFLAAVALSEPDVMVSSRQGPRTATRLSSRELIA